MPGKNERPLAGQTLVERAARGRARASGVDRPDRALDRLGADRRARPAALGLEVPFLRPAELARRRQPDARRSIEHALRAGRAQRAVVPTRSLLLQPTSAAPPAEHIAAAVAPARGRRGRDPRSSASSRSRRTSRRSTRCGSRRAARAVPPRRSCDHAPPGRRACVLPRRHDLSQPSTRRARRAARPLRRRLPPARARGREASVNIDTAEDWAARRAMLLHAMIGRALERRRRRSPRVALEELVAGCDYPRDPRAAPAHRVLMRDERRRPLRSPRCSTASSPPRSRLRGAEPSFLLCDAALPALRALLSYVAFSTPRVRRARPAGPALRPCFSRGRPGIGPLPIPLHTYREFASTADEARSRREASALVARAVLHVRRSDGLAARRAGRAPRRSASSARPTSSRAGAARPGGRAPLRGRARSSPPLVVARRAIDAPRAGRRRRPPRRLRAAGGARRGRAAPRRARRQLGHRPTATEP